MCARGYQRVRRYMTPPRDQPNQNKQNVIINEMLKQSYPFGQGTLVLVAVLIPNLALFEVVLCMPVLLVPGL